MSKYVLSHPFQEFNSANALRLHLEIDHNLKYEKTAAYKILFNDHTADHRLMAVDRRKAIDEGTRS